MAGRDRAIAGEWLLYVGTGAIERKETDGRTTINGISPLLVYGGYTTDTAKAPLIVCEIPTDAVGGAAVSRQS